MWLKKIFWVLLSQTLILTDIVHQSARNLYPLLFGCLILTNTIKVIRNPVPKADDPPTQFLAYLVNCRFFRICKLTTDSSLAYGGFYLIASMFDFKYHSVRLKLMHSVGHHQAVQNSRPTPVLCQIVSSPLVCIG